MIIDSHCHIGTMLGFDMREEELLASLGTYGIDAAIVSNVESTEFGHHWEPLPEGTAVSELASNRKTLDTVRRHPGVLYGQYWFKGSTESFSREAAALLRDNRDAFVGLKMHPYHSMTAVTDSRVEPWLDLAAELALPVAVHTAADPYSDPIHVYEAARRRPEVEFILVHLGLGSDNREAIDLVSRLPNLYGDTVWVSKENALEAVRVCGAEKILFGTDNPIDGIDTYAAYRELIEAFRSGLPPADFDLVMGGNARRLFRI